MAISVIVGLPSAVREVISAIPIEALRIRPSQQVWSVAEYLCHLRDVYVAFTIRLHRVRTEKRPVMEPMFNDLRARRFRYNDCDFEVTLSELAAAVTGFCEEVARTAGGIGIASPLGCQARIAQRAGWFVKRCTKVFTTLATSAESAASVVNLPQRIHPLWQVSATRAITLSEFNRLVSTSP